MMDEPADLEAAIRRRVRRSWWSAVAVGGVVAISAGATCSVLIGLPGALLAVAAAMSATAVIVLTAGVGVGRHLSRLRGGWTASARAIERALSGQDEPLSADQADRARRAAALAPTVATAVHAPRLLLAGAAVVAGVAVLLMPPHSFVLLVLGAISLAMSTVTVSFRRREARLLQQRGATLTARVPESDPQRASPPDA